MLYSLYSIYLIVCFFKQKTAYEMRISDWSSDVCSSDLGRLPDSAYAENFGDVHPPLDRKAALVEASRCYFCYDAPCIEACPTGIDIPSFIRKISTDKIGRASCRERVCQYV